MSNKFLFVCCCCCWKGNGFQNDLLCSSEFDRSRSRGIFNRIHNNLRVVVVHCVDRRTNIQRYTIYTAMCTELVIQEYGQDNHHCRFDCNCKLPSLIITFKFKLSKYTFAGSCDEELSLQATPYWPGVPLEPWFQSMLQPHHRMEAWLPTSLHHGASCSSKWLHRTHTGTPEWHWLWYWP